MALSNIYIAPAGERMYQKYFLYTNWVLTRLLCEASITNLILLMGKQAKKE